jgi:hypothetical protein
MTRIYCTNKLKKFIGNVGETLSDDFRGIKTSDWNAHLFFADKRKCVVFVNILTYYSVFVTDILKKDLKNIVKIFEQRLKEHLLHDRIIEDFDKAISLTYESKLSFFRTNNNKKVFGRINDFVDMFKVYCFHKSGNLAEMDIVYEHGLFNKTPTGKYADVK